jgi:hypothetical protein
MNPRAMNPGAMKMSKMMRNPLIGRR